MAAKNSQRSPHREVAEKLTAAQRLAAELFATNEMSERKVADIAKEVGVSERTIYRWKQDQDFIKFQNDIADRAMDAFLAEAYSTLKQIVRGGNSDGAKLKALELVLKNRGKLTDVQKVEATLVDDRSRESIEESIRDLERQMAEQDEPAN